MPGNTVIGRDLYGFFVQSASIYKFRLVIQLKSLCKKDTYSHEISWFDYYQTGFVKIKLVDKTNVYYQK